jgi:ABC-2 type transport system ATP-binding protein
MVLEVMNVSKVIKGRKILEDVNLHLEGGRIYGIVGRNGSGKTMLFRAISGLMKCSSGKVVLDGKELSKDFSVLPNIGLIIEHTDLYPEFDGFMNLKILAGIQKKIGKEEIEEAMARVGLDAKDKRIVAKYSMGMRQKLALAQAIMEKPDVILLDEPTNGLDEIAVEMVRKVLREEKERGALIMIASHNREDIVSLSDEVYRMKSGVLSREEVHQYEI